MELDKALDTVFDAEVTAPAVAPEPAPEQPPQQEPQAPEPAPQPAQEPQLVAAEPEPKDHSVPLAKFLDTRDELKEARRRIADFESRQQQPQSAPDPFDDPHGFAAHQQAQMTGQVAAIRFEMSEQLAKQVHGDETVTSAIDWAGEKAKADPLFAASYMRQPNPIDWIVRQHKRESVVSQIGDRSLDDFIKDHIAKNPELLASLAPSSVAAPVVATTQQAPVPAAPPRSLVDAPSSGGVDHVPMGLRAGVEAVFPR